MEEKFGNKEWVEAELKKMQPAPVEEIWAIVNKHIQKQPARRPEEQKQIPPSRMPVYARWQVWVPAAVVLGIAVTTGIVLTEKKHPAPGIAETAKPVTPP